MSKALIADAATLRAQARATDPRASAWVTANAGSGKTFVLTQRVIRLLLQGASPGRILCLTFTKAAAANMQQRVFETLGKWVMLPDGALAAEIAAMQGALPGAAELAAARRVFATALETPGGLKIQTIHAFCERLLHTFPLEANVPADFELLDEAAAEEIGRWAIEDALRAAGRDPAGPLGLAAASLARETSIDSLSENIASAIKLQRRLGETWAGLRNAVRPQLGVAAGESAAGLDREAIEGGIPPADWRELAARADKGSANDQKLASRLSAADKAAGLAEKARAWRRVFLTKDSKTKDVKQRKSIVTKTLDPIDPGLKPFLEAEAARVFSILARRRAAAAAERSEALMFLADAADSRIQAAKLRRGALDFDDMIERARELFQRAESAWVLFKLDGGIDHVLVDEAQDTNPAQWQIIRKLTEEFFAGHGRAPGGRTVFAVGDEKQSIFSFQGADPAGFSAALRHFRSEAGKAGEAFHEEALQLSFRTAKPVLEAVDSVFSAPENYAGLNADDARATVHTSARAGAPGCVELWPLVPDPAREKGDVLNPPVNEAPAKEALARQIAARIASWLGSGQVFAIDGVPLTAGDIMILVRSRDLLFDSLLRELKRAGVPVAGADRLKLASHIAVMDLIALGDAVLNPEDDLALAALLRSPLGGLSEEELFEIAHRREGSLRAALRNAAAGGGSFAAANQKFEQWSEASSRETPYGFYASALGPGGGWRALTGRLGPDSADAVEAFLAGAEACDGVNPPSLSGFIEAMKKSGREIKRDMEQAGGAVRVMTVHASKGLEARIVILADTSSAPQARHDARIHALPAAEGGNLGPSLIWLQRKETDPPEGAAARASGREAAWREYRRLLYVALTRARDQLVLCGIEPKKAAENRTWREMIEAGLQPVRADDGSAAVRIFGAPALMLPERAPEAAVQSGAGLPAWCRRDAPEEAAALPPVNASRALEAAGRQPPERPGAANISARRRGILMHRLFERLPEAAPADRMSAALRLLAREKLPPGEAEAMAASVAGLMERPDIAPIFGPGSRAEAGLAGRVTAADGRVICLSGRADRLAVAGSEVWIADLKTGRPPEGGKIPVQELGQLAAYRLLLQRIYPEKRIRCFILRTGNAALQEAPDSALDAAAHALLAQDVNAGGAAIA